ncbi:MAG: hypothetical protein WBV82_09010 [Myxococcaceae bacterium]
MIAARSHSGSVHVDTSQWPIVVHTTVGSPSDGQFDAYIREATEVLFREGRHVAVMDSSLLGKASAYARERKKEWLANHEQDLRRACLGTAFVLSSPVTRFAAATILLVRPFPTPYVVCATLEEAMAWARQRLSDANVPR